MYRSMEPTGRPPIDRVQVERPRSPSGASPVFALGGPSRRGTVRRAGPTSDDVTGAAFFDLDRTLLAGASGEVFSAAMRAAGFTSRSHPRRAGRVRAVQPHRRDAAVDGAGPAGGDAGQGPVAGRDGGRRRGRRRRAGGDGAAVRRTRCSTSTAPPVARSCSPRRRRTTSSSRSPTASASTTSSPPATASTPTAPTTARSSVRSSGPPASSRPSARGPRSTTSTWTRAMPTPTASTTRRCSPRSALRSSSTPTPGWSVLATARRWPILNLDVSPGVVKIPVLGIELQTLAMQFSRPALIPYARFDIAGVEHIPAAGPAILVANHRSYFDSAAMSMAIARSGRTVRFLGKKEVFDAPIVGQLATAMGGIRVDRGTGSDEPLQAAADALDRRRGRGDHAAGHDPARPGVLRPRAEGALGRRPAGRADRGAGRSRSGCGAPRRCGRGRAGCPTCSTSPTRREVRVRVGEPVDAEVPLARRRHEADHDGDHRPAARRGPAHGATPTAEELAATYPPGYQRRPDAPRSSAARARTDRGAS